MSDILKLFLLQQVVIQLANLSNFICPHQSYCHPNCYERQRRSCSRLITSVKKIYESVEEEPVKETDKKLEEKRDMLKERLKRRVGSDCYTKFLVKWLFAFEPRSKKKRSSGFRPGLTQTGMYSHRR